ncbi:SLAM family member 5 [Amia ocellicauda]|uniref:SLAM family member 5 n=1 Tax=Amia ocellicauda TaxID=2972642 RepID=UPI003464DB3A
MCYNSLSIWSKMKIILLFLLAVTDMTVMGTEIPAIELYGLKGDSINLEVQSHEQLQFKSISWKFNKVNIVEYNTKHDEVDYHDTYKPRVEFSKENKSLTIRNLEETDHGLYTAVMVNNDKVDVNLAKYNLFIQEKIGTTEMVVNYNSSSSETCNVSITCSVKGNYLSTFICINYLCREEARNYNRSAALLIDVHTDGSLFVCNASNRVSWSLRSLSKEKLCGKQNQILTAIILACVLCLTLVMAISVVIKIIFFCKKDSDTDSKDINSVYATIQNTGQEWNFKLPETWYDTVRADIFTSQHQEDKKTSKRFCVICLYKVMAVFQGLPEFRQPLAVCLLLYERIRLVQIQSQQSYGTDNKTCHLTLNCTVTGGSQVDLIWLKGKNKNPEETKQSVLQLTVKPTDDDYSYTCVASNPVSNWSDTIEGNECYTQGPSVFHVSIGCLLKSVLFSVGLLVMLSAVIAVHVWETLRHRKRRHKRNCTGPESDRKDFMIN